jgi:hypothetical protein
MIRRLVKSLTPASKEKIEAAIKEVIQWLDDIHHAEAVEFEEKLVGLELTCNPIIAKIYGQQ